MPTKNTTPTPIAEQALSGATGQRVLRLYHAYRLIISLSLVLIVTGNLNSSQFPGALHEHAFFYSCWAYLTFNILTMLTMHSVERSSLIFGLTLLDTLFLCVLFFTAGGPSSGIGSLIVVASAIANIMLYRHLGMLIAATGAAGIIYLTFYLSIEHPASNNHYMQAGILGSLCFFAALFVQLISKRLTVSESLAKQQAFTVANLEALNALILERMHTGILTVDEDYLILQANSAALKMLNSNKLRGANLRVQFPALTECYEAWQHNPSRLPDTVQLSDRTPQLQPSFVSLKQDEGSFQLLIFLDDTRQINQHAQHLKLLALGRLTAAISHELRNPLGAISHAAQLLNESEQLDSADKRLAQIIQDQSRRMNIVVENVLQASRQRPAEQQILDLKYWLHRFVSTYQESAPASQRIQLSIKGSALQTLIAPHQLDQVLTNLVSNAMRYSRPVDSQYIVHINLYRHPDSQLPILEILDNGPGIPEDKQQAMFEPFFTTDSKGTGLGLYISRELCEANQARLDYLPRKGGGSCFRITFAHPQSLGFRT